MLSITNKPFMLSVVMLNVVLPNISLRLYKVWQHKNLLLSVSLYAHAQWNSASINKSQTMFNSTGYG
jgi:hypothetical protein